MTKPQTKTPRGWGATREGAALSLGRLIFAVMLFGAAAGNHLRARPNQPGGQDLLAIAIGGLIFGSIAWYRGFFHKVAKVEPAQAGA